MRYFILFIFILTHLVGLFPVLAIGKIQEEPELKSFVDENLKKLRYPSPILKMDPQFTHHVVIAEKSSHTLHLFANDNSMPRYLKSFPMASGKKAGDKIEQGDFKTPEGIYHLVDFLSDRELLGRFGKKGEMYGRGAFVLNYPNPVDYEKNGGGIWLHSTDEESRIFKGLDSKGCVVVSNNHLVEVGRYIDLKNTMMINVHNLNFLREATWKNNLQEIEKIVINWVESWKNKDFNKYIENYHKNLYSDKFRKNYKKFKVYKKAVFAKKEDIKVLFENLSILKFDDYAVVQFKQHYESDTINDDGKKVLYLKRNNNFEWKIVSENWHKLPENYRLSFQPKSQFFVEYNDPKEGSHKL